LVSVARLHILHHLSALVSLLLQIFSIFLFDGLSLGLETLNLGSGFSARRCFLGLRNFPSFLEILFQDVRSIFRFLLTL
jgi:hypothetical protein